MLDTQYMLEKMAEFRQAEWQKGTNEEAIGLRNKWGANRHSQLLLLMTRMALSLSGGNK